MTDSTAVLVPAASTTPLPALDPEVADRLNSYLRDGKAEATWRAYEGDLRRFQTWCGEHGRGSLPADVETVAAYIDDLAERGYAVATIGRRLTSIAWAHKTAGHEPPTEHQLVRQVMRGVRRRLGVAQRQVEPIVGDVLRTMVEPLGDRLADVRDRALLLVGFAGAFRRSEVVSLDVDDVREVTEGLRVMLRRSKGDQEGEGAELGIPYGSNPETCPVRAYRAWLAASGIAAGPIFRPVDRHGHLGATRLQGRAVAAMIKRRVAAVGLDPAVYSGHSLRAGLCTEAASSGVAERDIMRQSRHKSLPMVRRYIRAGSVFRDNAAAACGL